MKLQQSLVIRLTIFISISLLIILLISVFDSAYVSLNQARTRALENLSHLSTLRTEFSNYFFENVEKQVKFLASSPRVSAHQRQPLALSTHYNPLSPTALLSPAENTTQGIIPSIPSGDTEITHRAHFFSNNDNNFILRHFVPGDFSQPPHYHNIYWGKSYYLPQSGWHIFAASPDAQGYLIGHVIKLSRLLAYQQALPGHAVSLWLDQDNHILPFSALPSRNRQHLQTLLQNVTLHDGWQAVPGYLALRTQLQGPGWQQVILYPIQGLFERTWAIIANQLPYDLAALLPLALMLFWLLHRHLARPLWDFVDIIGKTGPGSLSVRLPEDRQDELGQIARAYNLLLDTLYVQYDNLENKVAERTQALTKAKQQAEQANRRKSRHLTTISHELRTPLSGTLGAIELLQTTEMDDKQSQLAETAHQCTLSLLDIINNLLDFSRIESGQLSLHEEKTDLLPLLDQAMQAIQSPGQAKGLTLQTFVGEFVPLHLTLDGTRIRQILVNLLGNALKFTEYGGICLSVKRKDNDLIFTVSDSGRGIETNNQAEVFTPFFQAQGQIQGTGLGLTIASNLAKMMNGWLELESTPGLGTSISLQVPLKEHQKPIHFSGQLLAPVSLHHQLSAWGIKCGTVPEGEGPLAAPELRFLPGRLYSTLTQLLSGTPNTHRQNIPLHPWRLNVLLVDDAALNRDIIGMMLTRLGQNVTAAASGAQALALGQQYRFDLVLMDIRMPDMDGIKCTRRWRNDPINKDAHCTIIALSANTAPTEKMRTKAAGMNDYLSKPVTLAQLAEHISLTAEYQLQRDIPLTEQNPQHCTPLFELNDGPMKNKIHHALLDLLDEIDENLDEQAILVNLLHTLKGCLGQAGLGTLVCRAIDMESRVRRGFPLQQEETLDLRHSLNITLDATDLSEATVLFREVQK